MTIIVPYRNRESQLSVFINHMSAYLPQADILIVEQADNKPFNRAKLLNIGFLECVSGPVVMHDVDMLPLTTDYTPTKGVTQLAGSDIQQYGYLGGVTMFDEATFLKVGGYNNEYYHRAEDNELMFNLARLGIPVTERFGVFDTLPHERNTPEFIPALWSKARRVRWQQNQLSICEYKVISSEHFDTHKIIRVFL